MQGRLVYTTVNNMNKQSPALDFFGNTIHVGNIVAFMVVGYRCLSKGKVTKITEKMVFVEYKWQGQMTECKQTHDQVIVKPV